MDITEASKMTNCPDEKQDLMDETSEIHADITALNVRYDVFAMADCIIYIGLDGRMQTRI